MYNYSIKDVKKLGFKMLVVANDRSFGTIKPETYNTGKNHFKPSFRSVYIADCDWQGGFVYITSNIYGIMKLYRCKTEFETEIGNIFTSGKTRSEAIKKFVYNFTNKIYNKS